MDTSAAQQNVEDSQLASDACIWTRCIFAKIKTKRHTVRKQKYVVFICMNLWLCGDQTSCFVCNKRNFSNGTFCSIRGFLHKIFLCRWDFGIFYSGFEAISKDIKVLYSYKDLKTKQLIAVAQHCLRWFLRSSDCISSQFLGLKITKRFTSLILVVKFKGA